MSDNHASSTNWKFVKKLGAGAFGEVLLWSNAETNCSVAIKKCLVDLSKLGLDEKQKLIKRWNQELVWMKEISTDNIVRACPEQCPDLVEEQNRTVQLPVIAMEYCDGGNLRTKLQLIENVNGLSEYDVRLVLGALRNAISYLHNQHGIAHRDIKPDNIVIKYVDGKPIYKLTDMGYARILDEGTIQGSMVGSRNYFAPEIVEFAEYNNSVDYWSMGIVAFEIICGVYPFLQDETMFEALKGIKEKTSECIAITKSNDGKLCHHTELFPQNRLSVAFRRLIEEWLRLALEKDRRKRGYEAPDEAQPELMFYKKLDAALNAKVLTAYWLNRCQLLSYCVDNTTTMDSLYNSMEYDIKISREKLYMFLPAVHTLNSLAQRVQPLQLYDEQLASEDKPMLYLVDFMETGSLGIPEEPVIPDLIHSLFSMVKLRPQALKQCLLQVLFLHRNELRRIQEFLAGINEFAMNLENEIMRKESVVNIFQSKIVHYNGKAEQYETMVAMGKRLLDENRIANGGDSTDNKWEIIAQNLKNLFAEHLNIQRRLKMVLNRTRQFMKTSLSSAYQEKLVKQYEDFFEEIRDNPRKIVNTDIHPRISDFLKARAEFFKNAKKWLQNNDAATSSNKPSIDCLIDIQIEFHNILKIVYENQTLLNDGTQITENTKEYLQNIIQMCCTHEKTPKPMIFESITEKMEVLDIDSEEMLTETTIDTQYLIDQSNSLTQNLFSLWST